MITNIIINRTVVVVSVTSILPFIVDLVFILSIFRIMMTIQVSSFDDSNTSDDNCRYAQAGTPEVTLSTSYDEGSKSFTVTAEQVTQPTPGQDTKYPVLIPIKVALFGKSGQALPLKLQVCPVQTLYVYECVCIYAYTYFYTHIKILRNSLFSLTDLWP